MKICYLVRCFGHRSGTENYVYNMSLTLANMGHEVHIVTTSGQGQWDFAGVKDKVFIHQFDFEEEPFRGSWRLEKFFPLYACRFGLLFKKVLPGLIERHGIDIAEATDWAQDAWAYLPVRKVPVCVRLHGHPTVKEEYDEGRIKKWPKNFVQWSMGRSHITSADLVTAVSKSYADLVRRAWDIRGKDIRVVPIGINPEVFSPSQGPKKHNAILFVGRLEYAKGIEVLARAIPLILRKCPDAKFYLAGRDLTYSLGQKPWSQRLVHNFGADRVAHLGSLSVEQMVHHYQTSSVCVLPSLYEPGGMAAIEAMFCGCPVVASQVGGFEENIREGVTGMLIAPHNAWSLADTVIELLQNPEKRNRLALHALRFARQNFELKKVVEETLTAYRETILRFQGGPSRKENLYAESQRHYSNV